MSAWEEMLKSIGDFAAAFSNEFLKQYFNIKDKFNQLDQQGEEAYRLFQEYLRSEEAQLHERVNSELREAELRREQQRREQQQKAQLGNTDRTTTPSIELEPEKLTEPLGYFINPPNEWMWLSNFKKAQENRDAVYSELAGEVKQVVSKEAPFIQVDGKKLFFESLKDGNLIFKDEQENRHPIEPKQLPLSLETRSKIEALRYLQSLSKAEVWKMMREAQRIANREGRSVQEVFAEPLREKITNYVLKNREHMLGRMEKVMDTLKKEKEIIRNYSREVNRSFVQLKQLQEKGIKSVEGKSVDDLLRQIEKKKEEVNKAWERHHEKEDLYKQKLHRELKSKFPDMNVERMDLKEAYEMAKDAYLSGAKDTKELRDFLERENLTDRLSDLDKSLKEIEVEVEEVLDFRM